MNASVLLASLLEEGPHRKTAAEVTSLAIQRNQVPAVNAALKEALGAADAELRALVVSGGGANGSGGGGGGEAQESAAAASRSGVSVLLPLAKSVSGDASDAVAALASGVAVLRRKRETLHADIVGTRKEAEDMASQLENMQDTVSLLRATARYVRLVGKLRESVRSARAAAAAAAHSADEESVASSSSQHAGRNGYGAVGTGGVQLSGTDLPKIAKTLFEISNVSESDARVTRVRVVREETAYIDEVKRVVMLESREALVAGLKSMSQSDVASALQVYYNLGELDAVVCDVINDAKLAVSGHIARAMDHVSIFGPDAHTLGYIASSSDSTEKRQAALWRRLASSLDDITGEILKVWHLQRVIWKKRDPITHARFVDELRVEEGDAVVTTTNKKGGGSGGGELAEGALSFRVWTSLVTSVTQYFDGGSNDPTAAPSLATKHQQKFAVMVRETLINGFPRLATMLELFTQKVKSETIVKGTPPSMPIGHHHQLLAAVAPLEHQYLARTLAKLSDMVVTLLGAGGGGGAGASGAGASYNNNNKNIASLSDVSRLGKVMVEELIEMSGCPALLNKQCHGIAKVVRLFAERCEYASATGPESTHIQTMTGPSAATTATNAQLRNIALMNALQELYSKLAPLLASLKASLPSSSSATATTVAASQSLADALSSLKSTAKTIIDPLMASLLKRLETIVLSIHNESFDVTDTTPITVPLTSVAGMQASATRQSMFATRLINAMQHTRSEYLSRMVPAPFSEDVDTGEVSFASELSMAMTRRAMQMYCRNLAMLPRLGDDRRMKLATDMTNIEAAMSKYLVPVDLVGGVHQHTLRTLRPLLFIADDAADASTSGGGGIGLASSPLMRQDVLPSVIMYHLLMWRCPSKLKPPHVRLGMTAQQFSQWVDEHSEKDVLEAIKASLDEYASSYKGDDDIGDAALQRSFAEVQTEVQKVFDTLEATTRSNGNAI